jgi:hypothetical protein
MSSPPASSPASRAALTPNDAALSPSIARPDELDRESLVPSFELKFLVSDKVARAVHAWARGAMRPDPFADPAQDGAYRVSTLYLDTPGFDVFHGNPELEGTKYRVRRYGDEPRVWLERKTRKQERVTKRRTMVEQRDLARVPPRDVAAPTAAAAAAAANGWLGAWFRDELARRDFRPVCCLEYARTAFFGVGDHGGFRLTLDRAIRGVPFGEWDVPAVASRAPLVAVVTDEVICELKFRDALPAPFKQLVGGLALETTTVSKYRRLCVAAGIVAARVPVDD